MKKLNLGHSDFKDIIQNNNYFVDKSLFIEEILNSQKAVLLLPRPRRFGKTLNLSMLKYFFDKSEPENENLFKGLQIWQTGIDIKQHCCKYPVISLTFKDAKASTWSKTFEHIKLEISKAYQQHYYLLENNTLHSYEKKEFKKILNKTANDINFESSIKLLCEYLQRYHNEKVVVLIDEYDAPIQAGYTSFYETVVAFIRSLLSGTFKDNSNLYKGIITGILRISKESIFSGLNNVSAYPVTKNRFSDKFGFTKSETKQVLSDFNIKTDIEQIKKWYDGYKFGNSENIYNPWSILSYVIEHEDGFDTFWANTSSDELIKKQLKGKNANYTRQELLKLINNETIEKDFEENFVFTDLESDKELLWTLLLYSGYLTIKNKISQKKYELAIPNYEIKTIFQNTILYWLKVDVKIHKTLLENTANSLIVNNIKGFEIGFKQIIGDTFSYFDTAKNHEYVYHSYILGLLAIIGDDYIIKSNKESGEGRYDILLIPHDKTKNGIVIEIKQISKQQENENNNEFVERINKQINLALNQINKNKYYKELIENKIIKVPIVFAGKEPYITEQKAKAKNRKKNNNTSIT